MIVMPNFAPSEAVVKTFEAQGHRPGGKGARAQRGQKGDGYAIAGRAATSEYLPYHPGKAVLFAVPAGSA